MKKHAACMGLALGMATLLATTARAQTGVGSATQPRLTPNPFTNPAMNPYLNPYMTQMPMSQDAALLYLLGAQKAYGGIGSGQVGANLISTRRAPAEMPRSAMVPGGGAARYFQRTGPIGGDNPRAYYQRQNRYFGNNGR